MSNTSCDNLDETHVPAKKLKQARLVFKPLTPPSAKKDNLSNAQKRKFDEVDDDIEIIEDTNKDESKENKNVSGCLENGNVEPKENALKRKKIGSSDDELNVTKEEKSEKDESLNGEKSVKESLKDKKIVNEVALKDEKSVKESLKDKEIVNEVTLKDKKSVKDSSKNEKITLKDKETKSANQNKKKSNETIVKKTNLKDKTSNGGETQEKGSDESDEKRDREGETESKDEDIILIDLDENSSESDDEQSVVEEREESNEGDKTSKDRATTSEDVLNVSSSSAKEPPVTLKTPTSEKITKPRKLTPKQLEKQREREKIRSEKERKKAEELETKLKLKREKEELRRKELEEREKAKREKEESKKKELEEKKKLEELKRKEKEEKEKRRLAEIEQKNEERLQKEEEKRKMEDEKKKQEELKIQKEKKAKAAFASFFVNKPKTKQSENSEAVSVPMSLAFMPFQEKPCMKLAPKNRVTLSPEQLTTLDGVLAGASESDVEGLYLQQLKSASYQKKTSGKTWPDDDDDMDDDDDNEISIVDADDPTEAETNIVSKRKQMRVKLLQFHENHRPPYYGTWRKESKTIKPRNPCRKDNVYFDYEVDSDDEWEEGEGESLRGSDDEKESEDDYEVDNETFVPHGYLSDEEAQEADDVEDTNPEAQKLKLKLLGEEFEAELHEKTERLKPVLIGPMWINNNVEDTTCVDSRVVKYLMPRRAVWKVECSPISTAETVFGADENSPDNSNNTTPSSKSRKFTDEEIKSLIRLVHGSVRNRVFLTKEFLRLLESQSSSATQSSIKAKVKEIATYQLCPSNEGPKLVGRKCWFVAPEIRAQYGLSDLVASDNPHVASLPDFLPAPMADPAVLCITKFTKVLSEEDRLKQLTEMTIDHSKHQSSPQSAVPANTSLITKFTKVLSEEECLKQLASPVSDRTPKLCDKKDESPSKPKLCDKVVKSPSIKNFLTSNSPCTSAVSSHVSSAASQAAPKEKKRLPILVSVKVGEEIPDAARPSCAFNLGKPVVKEATAQAKPAEPSSSKPLEKACGELELMETDSPCVTQIKPSLATPTFGKLAVTPSSSAKLKKRVPLLASVKRGEQIPLSARPSAALSLFASKSKDASSAIDTTADEANVIQTSTNSKSEPTEDVMCIQLDDD